MLNSMIAGTAVSGKLCSDISAKVQSKKPSCNSNTKVPKSHPTSSTALGLIDASRGSVQKRDSADPQTNQQTSEASYRDELRASAISDEIISANFRWVDAGDDIEASLLYWAKESATAQAANPIANAEIIRINKRYRSIREHGGWMCNGLSLKGIAEGTYTKSEWGSLKPAIPRWDSKKQKPIKYEAPPKLKTEAFILDIPSKPDFWSTVLNDASIPLFVTEGAKTTASVLSMGRACIGAAGITTWNKPGTRELVDELAAFAVKDRVVYICLDEDSKRSARRSVDRETGKISNALRKRGCKVYVVSWDGSKGKGADDFIANNGAEAFDNAVNLAKPFEYWQHKRLSRLSVPASYTVPAGQKYIGDIPCPDAKFIGLFVPKGRGKTYVMANWSAEAESNGQRSLFLTHRKQLIKEICERCGVLNMYEVTDRETRAIAQYQGMGVLVQSLRANSQAQFHPEDWRDSKVFIDEVMQAFAEVLFSSTCKAYRVEILRNLQRLLVEVLSPYSDGQLIIADADLADSAITFINGLTDGMAGEPYLITSNYRASGCEVMSYECEPTLLAKVEECIHSGQKALLLSDSQKAKSRYSTIGLEHRLKSKFPHLKIGRIDSDTLERKDSDVFGCVGSCPVSCDLETREASEEKCSILDIVMSAYDIVIASPSLGTGVSIDLPNHFDFVGGFFSGVLSTDSVRQFLARLRANAPRYIHLPKRGLNFSFLAGGELSPSDIAEGINKTAQQNLQSLFKASLGQLDTDFLPAATKAYSQLAAQHNAGLTSYRDIIHGALADEGNSVTFIPKPPKDSIESKNAKNRGIELKVAANNRLMEHAEMLLEAEAMDADQLEKLQKKDSIASEAQKFSMEKAHLIERYKCDELTADHYILDEHGWHSKIRLHYYLTAGREYLPQRDRQRIDEITVSNALWAPDANKVTLSGKIAILEALKISELASLPKLSEDTPLLRNITATVRKHSDSIRRMLGFHCTPETKPIHIARSLLDIIGYGLGKATRPGTGKDRKRVYPIVKNDHQYLGDYEFSEKGTFYKKDAWKYECDRESVFSAWLSTEQVDVAERAFTPATEQVDVAQVDANPSEPPKVDKTAESTDTKSFESVHLSEVTSTYPIKDLIETTGRGRTDSDSPSPDHHDEAESDTLPSIQGAGREAGEGGGELYDSDEIPLKLPDISLTATSDPDWVAFERALSRATTMQQLKEAKEATPERVRRAVMAIWQADGRYELLSQKAAVLAEAEAGRAA